MSKSIALSVIIFVVGFVVGRVSVIAPTPATSSTPAVTLTPTAPTAPVAATTGARPGGALHGKIAEVLQVPQYTYVRFETGEWAAVDKAPSLAVGQEATVLLQNEMVDFPSPSLNRTFARLWFGTLEGAEPVVRAPVPAAPVAAAPVSPEAKAAVKAVDSSQALTLQVVDVYSEKAALAGKRVKVKGTVDRVNVVQGVHYMHLKDGTGDAAAKTDDLLCITSTEAEKGKSVTVEGVIALDKNVGMGPVPVVLDEAQVR